MTTIAEGMLLILAKHAKIVPKQKTLKELARLLARLAEVSK